MATNQRIIMVTRKSRLDELKERFNTLNQVKFYLEQLGEDYNYYLDEHNTTHQSINTVHSSLKSKFKVQILERSFLSNFIFAPDDIVVTVGAEGLVANTLKYLNGQPLVPVTHNGRTSKINQFTPKNVLEVSTSTAHQETSTKDVTMGKVSLDDGQILYAVNDFFVGPETHTSAFYELAQASKSEIHSSSGLIISTGFGSSGWLQSIIAGAESITLNNKNPLCNEFRSSFDWDSKYLSYSVREPFPAGCSGLNMTFGKITASNQLVIKSKMGEQGVIFSDGMVKDRLEFNAGMIATISLAEKSGLLVHG